MYPTLPITELKFFFDEHNKHPVSEFLLDAFLRHLPDDYSTPSIQSDFEDLIGSINNSDNNNNN